MKALKITLKNININEKFSEETTMFMADVYVDGVKTAHAKNDGHGGSSWYHAYEGKEDLLKQAERYALGLSAIKFDTFELDMNLENLIDGLIEDILKLKDQAKFDKQLLRDMETNICFGVPNSGGYKRIGYGKQHKLADLAKQEKGREAIAKLVTRIKGELKEGEEIFNKNLEPVTALKRR
jgi:hypothetical protein